MAANLHADTIAILSNSLDSAESIKEMIHLRGFDKVQCSTLANSNETLKKEPDLLIIEGGDEALASIKTLATKTPIIFLAETFNEEQFITAFDAGAKDYVVKPVTAAYLMSRILIALENKQGQQLFSQQQRILEALGAIGEDSKVFTTEHFIRLLKEEVYELDRNNLPSLSVLMLQLTNNNPDKKARYTFKKSLYADVAKLLLKTCRGSDIVGEYFEDKFAVIFPKTTLAGAQNAVDRIISRIENHITPFKNTDNEIMFAYGMSDFTGCVHYEDLLNKSLNQMKQNAVTAL